MPTLQIRNMDPEVYRLLAERARQEKRSLSRQAAVILEESLMGGHGGRERRRLLLERIESSRISLPAGAAPPEVLIREDRRR